MADSKTKIELGFEATGIPQVNKDIGTVAAAAKKLNTQSNRQVSLDDKTRKVAKKAEREKLLLDKTHGPKRLKVMKDETAFLAKQAAATREITKNIKEQNRLQGRGPGKPPVPPSKKQGPGTGGTGGGGGIGSFAAGAAGGIAVMAAGLAIKALSALVTMPFKAIGSDYEQNRNYRQSLSGLAGYAGGGASRASVDASRKDEGWKLGYTGEDVVSAAIAQARATGSGSTSSTNSNLEFSRLLGQSTSETAGMFGVQAQAGQGEKGQFNQIKKAIAGGMVTGLAKARIPEFLSGVMDLTSTAAGRAGGDVTSANYTNQLALLGRSKQSGLQGARGASVLKSLEGGFTSPGGGEEGQAMVMSAMGFGTGGGQSYYGAKKAMEQGSAGDSGFIKKILDYTNSVYGNKEEANLATEQMLGGSLTLDQIEKVQAAYAGGGSKKDMDAMLVEMNKSEVDVLRDIRELLSGVGSADLLKEARRSSNLQSQSVDRGEQTHEALETVQEIFNKFLNETMVGIAAVLTRLASVMEQLSPLMHTVATAMNGILSWLDPASRADKKAQIDADRMGWNQEADTLSEKTNADLTSLYSSSPESMDINAASEALKGLEQERRLRESARGEGHRFATSDRDMRAMIQPSGGSAQLQRDTNTDAAKTIQLLETMVQAITSRYGIDGPSLGSDGHVSTPGEYHEVLSFLKLNGVPVPPSLRSRID